MADKKKRSYLRAVVDSGGEPEKPKYAPQDFIIPASDSKGHSSSIGFRCMSGYLRDMDVFVSSRKFPYKTTSDVLRHALHNHIHWLAELEPKIPVRLAVTDTAVELCKAQQMLLKYQNTIREIAETVNQLTREGMPEQARRLVADIMREIDDDPFEDEWKTRLKREVNEKYGYLFPSGIVKV